MPSTMSPLPLPLLSRWFLVIKIHGLSLVLSATASIIASNAIFLIFNDWVSTDDIAVNLTFVRGIFVAVVVLESSFVF